MPTNILTKTWDRVRKSLLRARADIGGAAGAAETTPSGVLQGTVSEFDHFLEHNELELAWDALAAVGERDTFSSGFWDALADAAKAMGLDAKHSRAETRAFDAPIIRAFLDTHHGASIDRVVADPDLNRRFLLRCRELHAQGADFELNWRLLDARKNGRLPDIGKTDRFSIPRERREAFEFASEIAVRKVQRRHDGMSLDHIICDPPLAAEFDGVAARIAPGFTSLEYRWVALGLRKARRLTGSVAWDQVKLPRFHAVGATWTVRPEVVPSEPGIYLFDCGSEHVFVGETTDLRRRYERHLQAGPDVFPDWLYPHSEPIDLKISSAPRASTAARKQQELAAIHRLRPLFNFFPEIPSRTNRTVA